MAIIRQHQASAPVPTGAIARDLGIHVYKDTHLGSISGILRRDQKLGGPSGYVILVNAKHPPNRQRFTVAHEIAHFVLHRDQTDDPIEDDEFYRALSGPLEREANEFAADLLMPWHLINQLQARGITDLAHTARELGVSKQALAIRLGVPYDQHWD